MSKRYAFTLIELLIVVAIIAILAAIAVPNFLEAQTRAKASRVIADFRTIATALEAYRTDNISYPPTGTRNDLGNEGFIEPPSARLRKLTTPIPYLSSVPGPSPFIPPNAPKNYTSDFQYSTKKFYLARYPADNAYLNGMIAVGDGVGFKDLNGEPYANGSEWLILDRGPDLQYFFFFAALGGTQTWEQACVFYDPSNGTTSQGDIGRTQRMQINSR
jgi:type II secretion system protein G